MAHLEEAELLRTLILPTVIALPLLALPLRAEDLPPVARLAPGAIGDLGIDIDELLDRAGRDAGQLGQSLRPQDPMDLSEMSPGLQALEDEALNDPRIRALLGVSDDSHVGAEDRPGYGEARMLVFASFAMPAPSLRQIMNDADRFGAQVVFRGFVENSVYRTEEALTSVFGDPAELPGFAIDPTLFTRFHVEAVPVYVVLAAPVNVCETPGCAGDQLPLHDRISGNVPIEAALRIAAAARGDAATTASDLLRAAEAQPSPDTPERKAAP